MAQSSYLPSVNLVAIINPWFCYPYSVDLTRNNGGFTATNVNGNVMYEFILNGPHIWLNAAKNPLLTLQHKTHETWQVFRGDANDLLFSVKKSIQFRTQLDVFLASNVNGVCDFKIKGNWGDRSRIIYLGGDSLTIIAQMHGNNKILVCPNVDSAFIVALVVVLEKIHDA